MNPLEQIDLALMTFEPERYLRSKLKSVDDVHLLRHYVRQFPNTEQVLDHLIDLVWERVSEGRRRNIESSLRTIKVVLLKCSDVASPLSMDLTERLFELYQYFVNDRLEQIQWMVSAMLRNRELQPAHIEWLITHEKESIHYLNRILRYPAFEPQIALWAEANYDRPDLVNRRSEILARLICSESPYCFRQELPAVRYWAIYYSLATLEQKERMLAAEGDTSDVEQLIEVCLRLGLKAPLESLRRRVAP